MPFRGRFAIVCLRTPGDGPLPRATSSSTRGSALYLFLIIAGHARIERADAGIVGRFGPGDFFGELALIEEHARTATVIAEDELTCCLIPAWEFRALLDEHPAMAISMLHKVIARLHGLDHQSR